MSKLAHFPHIASFDTITRHKRFMFMLPKEQDHINEAAESH